MIEKRAFIDLDEPDDVKYLYEWVVEAEKEIFALNPLLIKCTEERDAYKNMIIGLLDRIKKNCDAEVVRDPHMIKTYMEVVNLYRSAIARIQEGK